MQTIPTLATDYLHKYAKQNGGDVEAAMIRVETEWGVKPDDVRKAMIGQVREWLS